MFHLVSHARLAIAAGLATGVAGVAHAGIVDRPASITTLHGGTFHVDYTRAYTLSTGSMSRSYTGPTTFLDPDDYTANPYVTHTGQDATTGRSRFTLGSDGSVDAVQGQFFFGSGAAASLATATWTFDVEFAGANGQVQFWEGNSNWDWTITPVGGSAVTFNVGEGEDGAGDVFANGRYTLTATYVFTGPFFAGGFGTNWQVVSAPSNGGGGAVPGPGAALVASMGLAGLSRRRRR